MAKRSPDVTPSRSRRAIVAVHPEPARRWREHAAFLVALAAAAAVLASASVACGDLAGLLGAPGQMVECEITGNAVGFDGGEVTKVDIDFYPAETAGTSETVDGTTDGSSFTITRLTIPGDATRVRGQLAVGEAPVPPLPLKYGQVRIDLDLPLDDCTMDLGDVALPAKDSDDDQSDEPIPGENNGEGGTNNGGGETSGEGETNNGESAGTNNGT